MTSKTAIEVPRIEKAIKIWCAGNDAHTRLGDILKICKKLIVTQPQTLSIQDALDVCTNLGNQPPEMESVPYAMGYATIKAFAGEDALKMLARTCGTTETPAGQRGCAPERHRDRHEKERRKRARRNHEPGKTSNTNVAQKERKNLISKNRTIIPKPAQVFPRKRSPSTCSAPTSQRSK